MTTVGEILGSAPIFGSPHTNFQVAVTLVPTSAREDFSSRLFTPSFKEIILDVVEGLEPGRGDHRALAEATISRDGYVVRRGTLNPDSWAWGLRALWNGTVAVEFAVLPANRAVRPPEIDWIIARAWAAAAEPLAALTGIPDREHVPSHFAVLITTGFHLHVQGVSGWVDLPAASRPIQRWTTMAKPSQAELEGVTRELVRSAGLEAFETAPELDEEAGAADSA